MTSLWMCLAFGALHLAVSLWQLHTGHLIDDVSFFDDALYQISHGDLAGTTQYLRQPVLADHAAFILYPLSLLYLITPNLRWLLVLQSGAIAAGGLTVALLSRQAGLDSKRENLAVLIYLLHPTAFNVIHDGFHPEELAIPALLLAVWAARGQHPKTFAASLILTMSCKWLLAFPVLALGVWLALCENRKRYGAAAILAATVWASVAAFWVIPAAGMHITRHVGRFNYLGGSWHDIVLTVLTRPGVWVPHIFSREHLWDFLSLFGPLAYLFALAPRLKPLLIGFPAFAVALFDGADFTSGEMTSHAPLPLQPPLMVAVVDSVQALSDDVWNRHKRWLTLWTIVAFCVLARFPLHQRDVLGYRQLHEATGRIPKGARVGTQRLLFPYVQRELATELPVPTQNLAETVTNATRDLDAVLLDTACEPSGVARAYAIHLGPGWQLIYEAPPVLLYLRQGSL